MTYNYDKFYARVKFENMKGKDLEYFYSKENLVTVKPEHIKFDNSYGFSIGRQITIDNTEYVIKDIGFRLEPETYSLSGEFGVNLNSSEDSSYFNLTIIVSVDNL